jgi:hypothetical protein
MKLEMKITRQETFFCGTKEAAEKEAESEKYYYKKRKPTKLENGSELKKTKENTQHSALFLYSDKLLLNFVEDGR